MAIRDWMGRHRLRRLERRGDVVLHWTDKAQALLSLGQDLIPERELLRNFYGLLVYAGAGLAGLRRQTSAPQGICAGWQRSAAAHISCERHQPSPSQLRRTDTKALDLSVPARGLPH